MQALSAAQILATWERGARAHSVDRALAILAAWRPSSSPDELARLSIGRRDGLLLAARQATFGDLLPAVCSCPACGEAVEFDLHCSQLHTGEAANAPEELRVEAGGVQVRLRLLDSRDLAVAAIGDVEETRRRLLGRCVTEAWRAGAQIAAGDLPESVCATLSAALAAADPQADITLDLFCPACSQSWQSGFDIAEYLWAEVAARARRLLREVHLLASTYGWSEGDILAMSAPRRAAYLELVST